MALDLYTVKEDFASMVQRVQPWTLSQFVMWLDLKVAEYKVHGYMILDFEDRLSQFFNTDLRREMAASQQLKKQPSPKITPKRTAPSMQLSSRQSTSATSTANLECSQEPLNNLGSSINQGRTHDWLMPQHTVSQVSHGSEVAQKETSVPSRLCPTIVRPREINQVENDPVPRDSQMDLVMDVETEADNAGIDINWTNSATEPISGSSVYHKNSLVYHEESPSFKNPSTYSKETNDYRKETSEYSKETSSSSKSMRTNQSQQNSEESSHGKTNTEHCGLSLPVTEIKIEDFKNDEEENANENFTVTVENSSSSNSLVETNDYMRIEENSDETGTEIQTGQVEVEKINKDVKEASESCGQTQSISPSSNTYSLPVENSYSDVCDSTDPCKHYEMTMLYSIYNAVASTSTSNPVVHSRNMVNENLLARNSYKAAKSARKLKKCVSCSYQTVSTYNLRRHIAAKHNVNFYRCAECPTKKFADKYQLRQHRAAAHSKELLCECHGKTFRSRQGLQQHLKKMVGEASYVCYVCNKAFLTKILLENHLNVHTGVKPYKCEFCGKHFSWRGSYYTHASTCHPQF